LSTHRNTASVSPAPITDMEFQRFREFFYRKTGIWFEDAKRYFVDKRLSMRMTATANPCFRDYFIMLRLEAKEDELQQLINLMTVNETYFFREDYQFKCLVNSVMEEVCRQKDDSDPIRIWIIPCSTGEEAYSVGLYLLEYWQGIQKYDVELVASDIDTNVLETCRQGIYSPRSLQYVSDQLKGIYFKLKPGGLWQISEDLRNSVDFCRVNLADSSQTRMFRGFDIVFCRNLLIYFNEGSRRNAVQALYDALNPGGFIFLGHSETMSRTSSLFNIRKFQDAIIYQKQMKWM
jgi:chemotaxis protein methyltransferase CheR